MKLVNRFGSGEIYSGEELTHDMSLGGVAKIYMHSTACLSVTSDLMSWASSKRYKDKVVVVDANRPGYNNVIIVLGCQVTDLAILNDIRTIERLHSENPKATVYVGGCLAYRFDIELPSYARRLEALRTENFEISDRGMKAVHWEKPFWVDPKEFDECDDELGDGKLFRDMYPLKVGAGCSNNCAYCTIRDTRGKGYEVDAYLQVQEFLNHDNVVIVSDNPTAKQIKDWCSLAVRYNKPISFRNVEPEVVCECAYELLDLAQFGLLNILHSPIQTPDLGLLKKMNRPPNAVVHFMGIAGHLRSSGVIVATNIIVDYTVKNPDGSIKNYGYPDVDWLNRHFDYWSWNPYFDGHWDYNKAIERWNKYMPSKIEK